MCIFTQPVVSVANTNIFARVSAERQWLAYEMDFAAVGDLAMVLPLPVVPDGDEEALHFIDLSGYARLFNDLARLFEGPVAGGFGALAAGVQAASTLAVVDVGAFEASYVPRLVDFARLDPRFRLPDETWGRLPRYRDYGFAVFKLKGSEPKSWLQRLGMSKARLPTQHVHAMAFSFPTRDPGSLFFPTVHVHDGKVKPHADFDHALYCQTSATLRTARGGFIPAELKVEDRVTVERTQGVVVAEERCHCMEIRGSFPNEDVVARIVPG